MVTKFTAVASIIAVIAAFVSGVTTSQVTECEEPYRDAPRVTLTDSVLTAENYVDDIYDLVNGLSAHAFIVVVSNITSINEEVCIIDDPYLFDDSYPFCSLHLLPLMGGMEISSGS